LRVEGSEFRVEGLGAGGEVAAVDQGVVSPDL